jgi:hypothetical protein
MSNNEKETVEEREIRVKIDDTVKDLQSKRVKWENQQKIADEALWFLLEESLSFYNFLRSKEDYERLYRGKRAKDKLTSLLVSDIFGKEKNKKYAYTKALDTALKQGIGVEGNQGMRDWLKLNGGVNGVIRVANSEKKKSQGTEGSRLRELSAKYAKFFSQYKTKIAKNEWSPDFTFHDNVYLPLIGKVNKEDGSLHLVYSSVWQMDNADKAREKVTSLYMEEMGKILENSQDFKDKRDEMDEKMRETTKEATQTVAKELDAFTQRINSVSNAEEAVPA